MFLKVLIVELFIIYIKKHKNKTLKGGSLSPLIIGLAGTGALPVSALNG